MQTDVIELAAERAAKAAHARRIADFSGEIFKSIVLDVCDGHRINGSEDCTRVRNRGIEIALQLAGRAPVLSRSGGAG